MPRMESSDLKEQNRSTVKKVVRAVRKPRKVAPASENVRGWAKSSLKSRSKS